MSPTHRKVSSAVSWQPDDTALMQLVDLLKLATQGDSSVQAQIFQVRHCRTVCD